ncbi:hypothetical protein HU200_005876 [Digitaria exilis]|uniref:F-box domain-containing protein n=1 Tax=Digitaria exilis TaxID=1010633 RepID=A0A835KR50_9POAL|nr:hypothetical protein HU200_005876 [Digitaria exilis]
MATLLLLRRPDGSLTSSGLQVCQVHQIATLAIHWEQCCRTRSDLVGDSSGGAPMDPLMRPGRGGNSNKGNTTISPLGDQLMEGSNHMGSHDSLLLDLPDDILQLILLSLHSPLWLLRAASTCKRWLRVASSAGFNRRFRAIHSSRPVVAGSYYNQGGGYHCPRFEPSPATAAAVNARHFSLDFIPGRPGNGTAYWSWNWMIKDSRESLLLIYRENWNGQHRDLIICEPLTYWDAIAVLLDGGGGGDDDGLEKAGGGDGVISMASFRVFLCSYEGGRINACMFTSGSSSWCNTSIHMPPRLFPIGFAAGRRYWHDGEKMVIALDQSTIKFSSFMFSDDKYSDTSMRYGLDMETMDAVVVDYKTKAYPLEFPWPPTLRACTDDNT